MLTGYRKHVSDNGIMHSVVDSPAWKHTEEDAGFTRFQAMRTIDVDNF